MENYGSIIRAAIEKLEAQDRMENTGSFAEKVKEEAAEEWSRIDETMANSLFFLRLAKVENCAKSNEEAMDYMERNMNELEKKMYSMREDMREVAKLLDKLKDILSQPGAAIVWDNGRIDNPERLIEFDF